MVDASRWSKDFFKFETRNNKKKKRLKGFELSKGTEQTGKTNFF